MAHRSIVIALSAASLALAVTGAWAVDADRGAVGSRRLAAAGAGARSVVEPPASTSSTVNPTTTVAAPPITTTTINKPRPPRTVVSLVPVTRPTILDAVPVPVPRVDPEPVGPSSWRADGRGITITARIEPTAPRVGDTVTIYWTTSASTYKSCCISMVTSPISAPDGPIGVAGQPELPVEGQVFDPCPKNKVPGGVATIVVKEAGPFTFTVRAHAVNEPCAYVYIDLFATFVVRPPATPPPPPAVAPA